MGNISKHYVAVVWVSGCYKLKFVRIKRKWFCLICVNTLCILLYSRLVLNYVASMQHANCKLFYF